MYNDGPDMAPWCYEYPNHPTTMAVTLRRRRGTDARGWEESGGCYLGPRTWFSTLGARCAQALADRLTDRLAMGWTNQRTNGRTVIPRSGFAWHTRFFRGLVWFVVVYLAATDVGGECSASLVAESHIYRNPGPRALGEGEEAHG